jgi:hypothetical protein
MNLRILVQQAAQTVGKITALADISDREGRACQ